MSRRFLPAVLSICASRVLFSLHELAEELVGHPTFALNNVELSRLNMRKGPHRSEFIVEVYAAEEKPRLLPVVPPRQPSRAPSMKSTRSAAKAWLPHLRQTPYFADDALRLVREILDRGEVEPIPPVPPIPAQPTVLKMPAVPPVTRRPRPLPPLPTQSLGQDQV